MVLGGRRGAVTLMAFAIIMITAMMALGAFLLGKTLVARHELQGGADAMARAMALAVQRGRNGIREVDGANLHRYMPTITGNMPPPGASAPAVQPPVYLATNPAGPSTAPLQIDVALRASVVDALAGRILEVAKMDIGTRATYRVRQNSVDQVDRLIPQVVLVLDYSSSMQVPWPGAINCMDGTGRSVRSLMNVARADLEVNWGLVLFGGGLCDQFEVSDSNYDRIRTASTRSSQCGAGVAGANDGATYTDDALARAGQMLDPTRPNIQPWERYVVIGTDGDPLPDFRRARAIAAADTLRMSAGDADDEGITVYSFAIWNPASVRFGPSIRQFVERIAGGGGDPDGEPENACGLDLGGDDHCFEVNSVDEMRDLFVDSMSDVACQMQNALSPRARTDQGRTRVFAFMRPKNDRTREARILADCTRPRDRWPNGCNNCPADEACDPVRLMPSGKVRIEDEPSCNLLQTGQWELVVRYDLPFLSQPPGG